MHPITPNESGGSAAKRKSRQAKYAQNRKTLYFRKPRIYSALEELISSGRLRAKSPSELVERLLMVECRRNAPLMRKLGIAVPEEALKK
jgi:hypothetical protein